MLLLSSATKNTCESIKNVKRKATKIIQALENKTCEERSKDWELFWMRNNFKMICENFHCLIRRTMISVFIYHPLKAEEKGEG